jgi:hypothetical protein
MGRVYATSADYATYSGTTPPDDIDRLLARASELLDAEVLTAAWYDTDDMGLPTNTAVAAAFAQAACAQVEFWAAVGEQVDTSGPIQGVTLGSLSIQYGAGDNRVAAATIGPRVYRALAVLPVDVFRVAVGANGWGCW